MELTRPFRGFATALDAALRGLDTDELQAFVICEVRGLSVREAAPVLETTKTDVGRSLFSARSRLRKELLT